MHCNKNINWILDSWSLRLRAEGVHQILTIDWQQRKGELTTIVCFYEVVIAKLWRFMIMREGESTIKQKFMTSFIDSPILNNTKRVIWSIISHYKNVILTTNYKFFLENSKPNKLKHMFLCILCNITWLKYCNFLTWMPTRIQIDHLTHSTVKNRK